MAKKVKKAKKAKSAAKKTARHHVPRSTDWMRPPRKKAKKAK